MAVPNIQRNIVHNLPRVASTEVFFTTAEIVLSFGSNSEGFRIASTVLSAVAEPDNWAQTCLNSLITATYQLTFVFWLVVVLCYFFYDMLYLVFDINADIKDALLHAFRVGRHISMVMFWICLTLAVYAKLFDNLLFPLILLQFSAHYSASHAASQIKLMNAEYESLMAEAENEGFNESHERSQSQRTR